MVSSLAVKKFEMKLFNAGKKLLLLPSSSTSQLLNDLQEMERLLYRVKKLPSKSMKHAMQPVTEALITSELIRHPDMNVNISVSRCIAEVLRIMAPGDPYNSIQMKDFFELAVNTFEKISSSSSGCYTKMMKVLKTFCKPKFLRLMCELQVDGLIVRLFKQFLTVADSNSAAVVLKMRKIMTTFIQKCFLLNLEVVDLLVSSVRKENQIASPVCWQLGIDVLKDCASRLKPYLSSKVSKEVYDYLEKTLPFTAATSKLRKKRTKKRKLDCTEESKSTFQLIRRCQNATKHSIKCLQVHSDNDKKNASLDGSSLTTKSAAEEKLGQELPIKVSSPQCGTICVQGYNVKESVAPILESLLKKHGDIAAKCIIKSTLVRSSFLEVVCENFKRLQTSDITTLVSEMEEIKSQVSDAEAANIDVSWLHAHLEDIEETVKKYILLTEMKVNVILVKRASRNDLKDRRSDVMDAYERFEKDEKCVKILELVEKKITFNIMQSKAENYSWAIKPILLQPLSRNVSFTPNAKICVQGYTVKQSVAHILEALFMKYGDITSNCVFTNTSVRSAFLEIVCEVVRKIKSSDVRTIISKTKEIENQLSDAEAANINVSWLRAYLEGIQKGEEVTKKLTMLMKTKGNIVKVKKVARLNLKERYAEVMAARERFERDEKTMKVFDLVEKKLNSNILELKADKDLWVEQTFL